jgi:plastocyanin
MKFKIIVITLILIAVFGVTYFYTNNKKVSEEDLKITKELTSDSLTIVYTNEGFIPKEISIKKGQTVKFINQSDRKMWVASNDHPSHLAYPEFDQKEITVRGAVYEFKFEKSGNWGYHNHLYSTHGGTINVTEN